MNKAKPIELWSADALAALLERVRETAVGDSIAAETGMRAR